MEQTSSVAPGGPGILGVGPGTLRQGPEGVEGARGPLESNRGSIGRSVHEQVNAWGNGLKRYVHHGIGHRKLGEERVAGAAQTALEPGGNRKIRRERLAGEPDVGCRIQRNADTEVI